MTVLKYATLTLPRRFTAYPLHGLAFIVAFAAICLATTQALMLSTRVYAYYSAATFAYAALLAVFATPLFYLALRGLARNPAYGPASVAGRAGIAAFAYGMSLIAVFDFNASLDRSTPMDASFAILWHQPRADDSEGAFINVPERMRPTIALASRPQTPTPLPFSLSATDELVLEPEQTRVVVPMRAGLFGIPWFPAADYRLEYVPGA
jgi:hypothetical protein